MTARDEFPAVANHLTGRGRDGDDFRSERQAMFDLIDQLRADLERVTAERDRNAGIAARARAAAQYERDRSRWSGD